MQNLVRTFIVAVLAADLFAIVYFAGHYMSTGQLLPAHETGEMHPALAALMPEVDVAEAASGGGAAAEVDVAAVLLAGDPTIGQRVSNKCKACHTFEQGGANRVGPNLWGVYGAKVAHLDTYSYSSALAQKREAGDLWNDDNLYVFLGNPRDYAPGTKMVLQIRKPDERAHLIAYLKTLK
jgi:cytochrome c